MKIATISLTILLFSVLSACEGQHTKQEPEQIKYYAELMKRYVPVEINCPVEIAWKIRNRKLIKKYWRQQP